MDHENPLDDSFVSRIAELSHPLFRVVPLKYLHAPKYLEPRLPGIVYDDQGYSVIRRQVRGADVLFVAPKVGEGEGAFVDDPEKPLGSAPVLDIRPSGSP